MNETLEEQAIRAYRVVRQGGLVLLPTDIGYGLVGCSADAVARIYDLKGRPQEKPCVTVADLAILDDVAELRDARLRAWLAAISARTPIAVVNRVRAGSTLLAALDPQVLVQATTAGTIATFLNAGALLARLAEFGRADRQLLVGSSANLSRTGNNYTLAEVPESIRARVDLVIDAGAARYANPARAATTILDLTSYRFLREGINHALIKSAWERFVRDELSAPAPAVTP